MEINFFDLILQDLSPKKGFCASRLSLCSSVMDRPALLNLYRNMLKKAVRFPSRNRMSIVREIKMGTDLHLNFSPSQSFLLLLFWLLYSSFRFDYFAEWKKNRINIWDASSEHVFHVTIVTSVQSEKWPKAYHEGTLRRGMFLCACNRICIDIFARPIRRAEMGKIRHLRAAKSLKFTT